MIKRVSNRISYDLPGRTKTYSMERVLNDGETLGLALRVSLVELEASRNLIAYRLKHARQHLRKIVERKNEHKSR